MSLGLNDNAPIGALAPEPRHKSAGLAFALSLIVPGAGQLYCGKVPRGLATLGFWLGGLIVCIARPSALWLGEALTLMLVLWIFSFLDAYYTAGEINRRQDEIVDVQNPRVAVTLNLLTAGFGYFYLGERTKGITLFVAMQVARFVLPSVGFLGLSVSISLLVVQLLVAEDAHRIARRQVKEALGPDAPPIAATPSRLPSQVPVAVACVIVVGFVALILLGLTYNSLSSRPSRAARMAKAAPPSAARHVYSDAPIEVVDFTTAVQDVQRVYRKPGHRKEEVANLQRDVRFLSGELTGRKVDPADAMVAHYFRAEAIEMINAQHERQGEAIDVAAARTAKADLDKVLHAGSLLTYIPEVTKTNAEYLAGGIARNELHDLAGGYSYWEQCAANAHAGCMNNLAGAMITGEGGEKVDVQEALKLHTSVFDTGAKYHCAGALSAMSIAYINYFLGVRRPGDDELEWSKKSGELLDELEASGSGQNVCNRSRIEVDQFLLQLGKGHRDDNILQDAMKRVDEDEVSTRAVVQFISGALDENGFNSAIGATKNPGARCSAYFEAMWYSELRGETATANRFHQQLVDIGTFHCSLPLAYAAKYKF